METAISIRNISKSFTASAGRIRRIQALDRINLDIHSGEILGILGPNGAGKTTLLNILSTLLLPDSGEVEIFGKKLVPKNFNCLRAIFNLSSGHPNFPWSLTLEENLKFYGMLYGLQGKELNKRAADLIDMFGLGGIAKQRFDELSSGSKQKLSLAKVLLNNPKIFFLDEPTIGLDPDVAARTREIIIDVFKKTKSTILLTTHYMHEAEMMCSRIAFIKGGKLLKLATPDELKSRHNKKNLEEVFIEFAHNDIDYAESAGISDAVKSSGADMKCGEIFDAGKNIFALAADWVRRCFAFTYRIMIFAWRNFFAIVELVFWPIVGLLSIGLLGSYLQLEERALAFVLSGAITAGLLQVTQLDVAYSMLYEVWSKSVKHTFLTPVGISEQLFGSWVIGIIRGTIIFFILGVSAMLLFGFEFPSIGMMIIFMFGIYFSALLLGFLVNFLILIFGQKAEITAWMFAYLFMLICGIYYPVDTLPSFFRNLAQFIPITYFLEYFRQNFGFEPVLKYGLLKGFGLIIIYVILGLLMMDFAFTKARKKGTIIRLSE